MIRKVFKHSVFAFVLVLIVASFTGCGTQPAQKQVEYTQADLATMMQELDGNLAAANKKYKDQYLKVSGKVVLIDKDAEFITIKPDDTLIRGVNCTLKKNDKAQKEFVLKLSENQQVTAYGKIVDMGPLVGYVMDVDKFE